MDKTKTVLRKDVKVTEPSVQYELIFSFLLNKKDVDQKSIVNMITDVLNKLRSNPEYRHTVSLKPYDNNVYFLKFINEAIFNLTQDLGIGLTYKTKDNKDYDFMSVSISSTLVGYINKDAMQKVEQQKKDEG